MKLLSNCAVSGETAGTIPFLDFREKPFTRQSLQRQAETPLPPTPLTVPFHLMGSLPKWTLRRGRFHIRPYKCKLTQQSVKQATEFLLGGGIGKRAYVNEIRLTEQSKKIDFSKFNKKKKPKNKKLAHLLFSRRWIMENSFKFMPQA